MVRGEISWFFSSCDGNLGFPLFKWGCSLNTRVFSAMSGLLSSFQGHLEILLLLWQGSRDTSRFEEVEPESLSSWKPPVELRRGTRALLK